MMGDPSEIVQPQSERSLVKVDGPDISNDHVWSWMVSLDGPKKVDGRYFSLLEI